MTLPYFIFLCTIPHKETRFLFPILMISPFFILMAFNGYYLSEKNSNQKVLQNQLNKINKSFKDAFGIKEDPIYYNQESKVYTYKFDILKIDGTPFPPP